MAVYVTITLCNDAAVLVAKNLVLQPPLGLISIALVLGVKAKDQVAAWIGTARGGNVKAV